MALTSNVAASTTAAGNAATYRWLYQGPAINADPDRRPLVTSEVAIRQVFDWFDANGGDRRATPSVAFVPGVNMKIQTIR